MRKTGVSKSAISRASALLAGVALSAVCGAAHASTITFAQFEEAVPNGGNANLFSYTESGIAGGGGTATLTAVSIPVTFTYQSIAGLPADLQGPQAATLTLTSITDEAATTGFGGTVGGETFYDINDTMPVVDSLTITRDTPAAEGTGDRTDLLTASFDDAALSGILSSHITEFGSLTPSLSYASDFLNLNNALQEDFNLAFSSWDNTSGGGGLAIDSDSSFFYSATAAGVGTFDIDPDGVSNLPEPAALGVLGLATLAMVARRRKTIA